MFSLHHYKTFFLIPDILLILKSTLFDISRATPTFFDRVILCLFESKFTVSKLCADMSWGSGGVGRGRGGCHGTPQDISKFHGNLKTQHLIGHCKVRVKICHCFPTNWSYVSFDDVIFSQSRVFFSFLNFSFFIGVQPVHNVVIVSGEQRRNQPYVYMYLFSPKPPNPGCHTTLSRVSYAIQYIPVGCPF